MTDYYEQKELWDRDLSSQEIERLEIVKRIIPDDVISILDVGCGNGALSNFLDDKYDILGIDQSTEALKFFKNRKLIGSISSMTFEDKSFDLVICSDVLEHLDGDNFQLTVEELARVSKKYLLVISPNDEDLRENLALCRNCGKEFHINSHLRSLSFKKIKSLFDRKFHLSFFTFFGDRWDYNHPLVTKWAHRRGEYIYYEFAVCPSCGKKQGEAGHAHTERPPSSLMEKLNHIIASALSILHHYSPSGMMRNKKCEVLMLFARKELSSGFLQLPDFHTFEKQNIIISIGNEENDSLDMIRLSPNLICPHMDIFKKTDLIAAPYHGYILKNDFMNWEDCSKIDGRGSVIFQNLRGSDNHGVFAFPRTCLSPWKNTLSIEYKDTTDSEILVQLYDANNGVYKTIGILSATGHDIWKTAYFNFDVPHTMGKYCLFRLVSSSEESFKMPIHTITLGSSAMEKSILKKEAAYKWGIYHVSQYANMIINKRDMYLFHTNKNERLFYLFDKNLYLIHDRLLILKDLEDARLAS